MPLVAVSTAMFDGACREEEFGGYRCIV